ncbi:MAG: hypothetical protein IBX64_01795 [Actinobacteria bacterium]|nr:hypothetical protein [Actinomycetota bacterium]
MDKATVEIATSLSLLAMTQGFCISMLRAIDSCHPWLAQDRSEQSVCEVKNLNTIVTNKVLVDTEAF